MYNVISYFTFISSIFFGIKVIHSLTVDIQGLGYVL